MNPILWTHLNDGTKVLGLTDKNGRVWAKTYANRTQANKAAEKARMAGFSAFVWQPRVGPVFYVVWDIDAAAAAATGSQETNR